MGHKIKKDFLLRINFYKKYFKKQLLKSFIKNPKISIEERQFLKIKFNSNYKKIYSISRIKNHCLLTQNTHSIYKSVKLSRHSFKNMVLNGNLPGCI